MHVLTKLFIVYGLFVSSEALTIKDVQLLNENGDSVCKTLDYETICTINEDEDLTLSFKLIVDMYGSRTGFQVNLGSEAMISNGQVCEDYFSGSVSAMTGYYHNFCYLRPSRTPYSIQVTFHTRPFQGNKLTFTVGNAKGSLKVQLPEEQPLDSVGVQTTIFPDLNNPPTDLQTSTGSSYTSDPSATNKADHTSPSHEAVPNSNPANGQQSSSPVNTGYNPTNTSSSDTSKSSPQLNSPPSPPLNSYPQKNNVTSEGDSPGWPINGLPLKMPSQSNAPPSQSLISSSQTYGSSQWAIFNPYGANPWPMLYSNKV